MEILVISGLSGAGKSGAAHDLEDMGYYTIDNMPTEIISKFADFTVGSDGRYDRVALVCDIRGGSENFLPLLALLDKLNRNGAVCRLLYLTASVDVIIKRYKETRRRHPLLEEGMTIEEAVRHEEKLLKPLRERADYLIDTSELPVGKLKSELFNLFGKTDEKSRMSINVMSFGYKYGLPIEADLVFDVRFMPNPFYVPELKNGTGMDENVYDYVFSFAQTQKFLHQLEQMLAFLLPLYEEEGKAMLVIAIGCTGGHHRSVAITRALTDHLLKSGWNTFENHRDMTRGV